METAVIPPDARQTPETFKDPEEKNTQPSENCGDLKTETESQSEARDETGPARLSGERRKAFLTGGIIAGLLLIPVLLIWILYFGMIPIIPQEYGYGIPNAELFYPGHDVRYLSVPDDAEEIGLHRCRIETDRGARTVWIRVRDTIAPAAESVELIISSNETVTPDQLVTHLDDKELVKISFLETPPFGKPGDYEVPLVLEDRSGNRQTVTSYLSIRVTKERVRVEAGSKVPGPEIFLIDAYEVEQCSEITEQMMHEPGQYPVSLTIDGKAYASVLEVVDTVPPAGKTTMVLKTPGETVKPSEFLTSVTDETEIEVSYASPPDADMRDVQTVMIRLTDRGGNYTDLSASLLYTHARPVTVEARKEQLTVQECVPSSELMEGAAFTQPFIPDTVGTYAIRLTVDGREELALVEVKDSVPPVLEAGSFSWYTNHPVDLETFCERLSDVTETSVTAEPEIDWSREGLQKVTLIAADAGGNTARAELALTLKRDTEAPKLYGVVNRNAYVGEPVAYLSEIFATDNLDQDLAINVDVSGVNPNKAGTYPVIYSVSDTDGNVTTASCKFKFTKASVSDDAIDALAASVASGLFTAEMTKTEQLEAIFNYVRSHVHYVGSSDKNDWRKEAERGIKTGKGDCFTFYSVTRALLDQTDIDYMSLTRKGGSTKHYWVIVNVGTGWYHFDPTVAPHHKHRCFMWTNKQCKVKPYFWRFEESKYPKIAEKTFDKNAVIALERAGTLGND